MNDVGIAPAEENLLLSYKLRIESIGFGDGESGFADGGGTGGGSDMRSPPNRSGDGERGDAVGLGISGVGLGAFTWKMEKNHEQKILSLKIISTLSLSSKESDVASRTPVTESSKLFVVWD